MHNDSKSFNAEAAACEAVIPGQNTICEINALKDQPANAHEYEVGIGSGIAFGSFIGVIMNNLTLQEVYGTKKELLRQERFLEEH